MESDSSLFGRNQGHYYPVDLPSMDYTVLIPDSEYLSSLKTHTESFRLSNGTEIKINHDCLEKLRLFGPDDPPHSLLLLHKPEDENHEAALYIDGKWWHISDVLKTSSRARNGLVFVESVVERVILFLLSQIEFGVLDRPLKEDLSFSHYSMSEHAKVFWQDGEAVGFYTMKRKGTLCGSCTGQCYLLPVLDTVFVRKHWRRNGLALQILHDFCTSLSTENVLGISYPISAAMYGVCRKYLEIHQEQRERLYEVEAPGEWSQRRNVWLRILQDHPVHKKPVT